MRTNDNIFTLKLIVSLFCELENLPPWQRTLGWNVRILLFHLYPRRHMSEKKQNTTVSARRLATVWFYSTCKRGNLKECKLIISYLCFISPRFIFQNTVSDDEKNDEILLKCTPRWIFYISYFSYTLIFAFSSNNIISTQHNKILKFNIYFLPSANIKLNLF